MIPLPSHDMPARPDIAVYARDKRLVLAVEVKDGKEPSGQAAAALRRNLISHKLLTNAPYFLLAYRTRLFLWREETAPGQLADCSALTTPVLHDYASSLSKPESTLRGSGLQIVIFAWLADLASGARKPESDSEPEKMLVDSGLYERIHLGDVQFEAET
jgi:hypothetical protein